MSDEKEGIIDSLVSAVKSRIGNPLIGSFIISWTVFNWRFLCILFTGDEQMVNKIRMLEVEYMPFWRMLIAPFFTAWIWALTFPYVDNFVENRRRKPLREGENKRIYDEIEFIKLRKKLSEETTALAVEEKKALSLDFEGYRADEIDAAQREVEYRETRIKDLEKHLEITPSAQKDMILLQLNEAHNSLGYARERLRDLRRIINKERAEKMKLSVGGGHLPSGGNG